MPNTFWPDLLVVLIATTLGALLTVWIAFGTYRYELRTRERDAIRHLANIIASRRAFMEANPVRVDTSEQYRADDLEACRASVTYAREAIIDASRAVRPGSPMQQPLDDMARATNRYLDQARRDPNGYWLHLNELRTRWIDSLASLSIQTKFALPEPGSRGSSRKAEA
ncbi:hypothetical protein [Agromyces sp. CF514]|uniref:hypothetical protein n=1 Tax=Agromyces sp. CF514 TaxID=1881031 RepID=UPI0011607265|nr:hypothetical protein [Agromyces sp. CF514]